MSSSTETDEKRADGGRADEGARTSEGTGRFSVRKIYVKDVSFETPNSPSVFNVEWKPKVDVQMHNESIRVAEDLYEVVLRVTVTVTAGEQTAFLVEVNQAGLFGISDVEDEERLKAVLGAYCPGVLFPYARHMVSDLVTRGGFPQFLLAPVNFDAVYAQHLEEEKKKDRGEVTAPPPS